MDVKQAFLQSDELQREVNVIPPVEANLPETTVWKLRTAVYGLADASRKWFFTAKRILVEEMGLIQVRLEQAMFYSVDTNGKLEGIVVMHVDDFLYGGTQQFISRMEQLKGIVTIGRVQCDDIQFCGLSIHKAANG